jgi:CrcB protein
MDGAAGWRALRSELLAVAVGAVAGASLRWGINELISVGPGAFPAATLVVNLTGCLLAGIAAARLARRSAAWLLVVTGFLGGLTTFSAFAAETRQLLDGGRPATAGAYVAASVAGGLAAAQLGRQIGRARP